MSVKGKGLVRKITKRQALAYEKTVPNRRGVTALVELNGPGSYEQRYKRAQQILNSNSKGKKMAKGKKKKVMTKAQYAKKFKGKSKKVIDSFYGNYLRVVSGKLKPGKKKRGSKKKMKTHARGRKKTNRHVLRFRKNEFGAEGGMTGFDDYEAPAGSRDDGYAEYGAEGQVIGYGGGGGGGGSSPASPAAKAAKRARAAGKSPKAAYVAVQLKRGRSQKQAENDWKLHSRGAKKKPKKKVGKKATKKAAAPKSFRRLKLQLGKRARKTYLYRGQHNKICHIPEFAYLGYGSLKAAKAASGTQEYAAKRAALIARREKAAAVAARRIMAGKDIFTPNEGIKTFEAWKAEQMNANKKKAKKKGKKGRKLTKAERRKISLRNLKKAHAARRGGKKGSRKAKKARKSTSKKPWMKGLRAAHAARRAGKGKRKGRKHTTKRRIKKSFRAMTGRSWAVRVTPARRKKGKKRGSRGMVSIHLRKNYRRNFGGAFTSDLVKVVKVGALVLSGYVLHRALTKALDTYGTAKITAVTDSPYRGLMSSAVVALVGIPGAIWAGKKAHVDVAPVVGGMAASLLHGALLAVLNAAGQAGAVNYLSGYAEGGGRAYRGMGEYYSFKPRQVFNGMGEFYEVLPQSGFGLDTAQLRQAAGSYPMEAVGFTQASGGMGAAVTQAAGAAGEYIVYGAEGMGDYEEVVPTGSGVATNDGIRPNLHEAEQALNIVEAAGSMGDLPSQMTVDPTVAQRPVAGEPGGSRAGILAGGDGIFG
jgi:hypothetical protein